MKNKHCPYRRNKVAIDTHLEQNTADEWNETLIPV